MNFKKVAIPIFLALSLAYIKVTSLFVNGFSKLNSFNLLLSSSSFKSCFGIIPIPKSFSVNILINCVPLSYISGFIFISFALKKSSSCALELVPLVIKSTGKFSKSFNFIFLFNKYSYFLATKAPSSNSHILILSYLLIRERGKVDTAQSITLF